MSISRKAAAELATDVFKCIREQIEAKASIGDITRKLRTQFGLSEDLAREAILTVCVGLVMAENKSNN